MPELTRDQFLQTLAQQQGLPPERLGVSAVGAQGMTVDTLQPSPQQIPMGIVPITPKDMILRGMPRPQGVEPRGRYQVLPVGSAGRPFAISSAMRATKPLAGDDFVFFLNWLKPEWGKCGEFLWVAELNVVPAKAGWVIQHAKIKRNIYLCPPNIGLTKQKWETWEAFKINADGTPFVGTYPVGDKSVRTTGKDSWYLPEAPKDTWGNWSIQGECYFSDTLPAELIPGGNWDASGELPASKIMPPSLAGASPSLIRGAQGTWNCCGLGEPGGLESKDGSAWAVDLYSGLPVVSEWELIIDQTNTLSRRKQPGALQPPPERPLKDLQPHASLAPNKILAMNSADSSLATANPARTARQGTIVRLG